MKAHADERGANTAATRGSDVCKRPQVAWPIGGGSLGDGCSTGDNRQFIALRSGPSGVGARWPRVHQLFISLGRPRSLLSRLLGSGRGAGWHRRWRKKEFESELLASGGGGKGEREQMATIHTTGTFVLSFRW